MSGDGSLRDSTATYWAREMDAAYEFMLACLARPLRESGEPLVALEPMTESGQVEVAYSRRPHVGGVERVFVLRQGLVPSFLAAAAALNERGYILKVEDAYRSRAMQRGLATDPTVLRRILNSVLAETAGAAPDPELLFRRVSSLVSTRPHIATHMSGSAIDISVLDRGSGQEVDRGGPYLEMSARTPMDSPFVSDAQRENRQLITAIMAGHGFAAYPWEFWHYSASDVFAAEIAGQEVRYGPVAYDAGSETIVPIDDGEAPMVSPEELVESMRLLVDF
jgi:D-alanyl-D-alanine dipeptidase